MKNHNFFYRFVRLLLSAFFHVFFRFRARGRGFVPPAGGCIIASNHLSYLDPIVLSLASPRVLSFMAKIELFENPLFAALIRALNAFPVHRGTGDFRAVRTALGILKKGNSLIIFPEGGRSPDGRLQEKAEPGVGLLASRTGIPVVPALIVGTDRAMPVNSRKVSFFQPIRVCFGPALTFKDLGLDPRDKEAHQKFSDAVLERIRQIQQKNACK